MAATVKVKTEGVSLLGLVFIVFLVLKLCGVIGWSWWWVTCPLWGPLAIAFAVVVVALIGALFIAALSKFI